MRKMETRSIRDSVYVEGEETTCFMFDERAGKTWMRGEGSHGLRD